MGKRGGKGGREEEKRVGEAGLQRVKEGLGVVTS